MQPRLVKKSDWEGCWYKNKGKSSDNFRNKKKIDSRYSKVYKLAKKDKTNRNNQDHWNKDKNKSSHNLVTTNVNQLQAQVSKKDIGRQENY